MEPKPIELIGTCLEGHAKMQFALALGVQEYRKAVNKFPEPLHSAHEAFAVIHEEYDELKAEVWKGPAERDLYKMKTEAAQLLAMALRLIVDVCMKGDPTKTGPAEVV